MAGHDHLVPARVYILNFCWLMFLMFLTVYVWTFDFGVWNLPIALGIAVTKATFIVLFFMNVKYSSELTWVFAGAGWFWLLIMLGFTLTDYAGVGMGTPYTQPL